MHVKIQGGKGGTYANSGSCSNATDYLEHEDNKNIEQGKEPEPFFNHRQEKVKSSDFVAKIDKNKAKLSREDAKFFVITVSPSSEEIKKMGNTPAEQSEAFKNYIKNDFAQQYAENFNKNLSKDDLMYYAKIHTERKGKNENDMHAHIIVSRRTFNNETSISSQTNHRGTSKGPVNGGFDRTNFFNKMEKSFDKRFDFERDIKKGFEYKNTMQHGTLKEKMEIEKKAQSQQKTKEAEPKKEIEKVKQQNNELSR